MKKSIITLLTISFFGLLISAHACHPPPRPPSCPTCPDGSTIVDINFDDYLAGTLVGSSNPAGEDHMQRYTSTNNSNLNAGEGFTVEISKDNLQYRPCEMQEEVGALFDTDRRGYYTDSGQQTQLYNDIGDVDNRVDSVLIQGPSSGEDWDLETEYNYNHYTRTETATWAGGNMGQYNLGNALIIQQSTDHNDTDVGQGHLDLVQGPDQSVDQCGWIDERYAPNDYAWGGDITFGFESTINAFGFTFVDADLDEVRDTTITFFDATNNESVTVSFEQFSNPSVTNSFADESDFNTQSGDVTWGERTANRIDTISVDYINSVVQGSNLSGIDSVTFSLKRSGGITGINYCHYTPVPEASTSVVAACFGLIMGFHFYRRKKKK